MSLFFFLKKIQKQPVALHVILRCHRITKELDRCKKLVTTEAKRSFRINIINYRKLQITKPKVKQKKSTMETNCFYFFSTIEINSKSIMKKIANIYESSTFLNNMQKHEQRILWTPNDSNRGQYNLLTILIIWLTR